MIKLVLSAVENIAGNVEAVACVAGGSGCARETFCGEAPNSLVGFATGEAASEIPQLDSSPFFSRPARLFALAFGTEVRTGTHSRRLRRL